MQRLGENAMWLREDNVNSTNEIVIPYDVDLATWDRPSWMDSLFRLRWCCPGGAEGDSQREEATLKLSRGRDFIITTTTTTTTPITKQATATTAKASKKSKKKKKREERDKAKAAAAAAVGISYGGGHYEIPPPPPPLPPPSNVPDFLDNKNGTTNERRYYDPYYSLNHSCGRYPQQHQYPYDQVVKNCCDNGGVHRNILLPYQQRHKQRRQQETDLNDKNDDDDVHEPLLDSITIEHHQHPVGSFQSDFLGLSSLSSSGTDFLPRQTQRFLDEPRPLADAINPEPGAGVDHDEVRPSVQAALAAATAAATLKRQAAEKQQPRSTPKNFKRPPMRNRGLTPQPTISDALPHQFHPGIKPPLPQQRSRSLSPSAARPLSPSVLPGGGGGAAMPMSPNSLLARPRLFSDGSNQRSMGTASTRHRRKAHETFEFSDNSLQQIVEKPEEKLSKTEPPAYIEYPSHRPSIGELSALDCHDMMLMDDDYNDYSNESADDEIQCLVHRASHGGDIASQQLGCVAPADSADEAASALEKLRNNSSNTNNPNFPALSWTNSWAAQGDAAAGNPTLVVSVPSDISSTKPVIPRHLYHNRLARPAPTMMTEHAPQKPSVHVERPVYLPRCKLFDRPVKKAKNRIIVAGWAAISYSDKLRTRLAIMEGPLQLQRSDIGYFQLIKDRNKSKRPVLRVKQGNTEEREIVLKDRYEHQFQILEVCGRAGRCVCLVEVDTRNVLLTILPVSLPEFFFRGDLVVDEKYFAEWQAALFTPFTIVAPRASQAPPLSASPTIWSKDYCALYFAPDEQNDAATHLLFALDSSLKPNVIKHSTFVDDVVNK